MINQLPTSTSLKDSAKLTELNFQTLVEATPNAIVLVNQEGKIAYVNNQTERLFRYDRAKIVGQFVEVLIPERYHSNHSVLRSSFNEAPTVRMMGEGRELYALRSDGSEFPIEIGLNPVVTVDGTLILASIIDITERKKADERFRLLVEYSPNALILIDKRGLIKMVNSRVEILFGYKREELIGCQLEQLLPDRFTDKHPGYRKGFFDSPEPRSMGSGRDLFAKRKDGSEMHVEIGLNPIETEEETMVLASIIDITARKIQEETIIKQVKDLEIKNQELEQFAYIASHDLQEPLRTIMSFNSLLTERLGENLDEESKKYFYFVNDASQRMSSLVRGLLDYSRIGLDRVAEWVDCEAVVATILQDLGAIVKEKEARIYTGMLPRVKGNEIELRLLFQNIISNSIKFCEVDIQPKISINASKDIDCWHFTITDNGIGIKPDHHEKIFTIFQRLHSQKKYKGTGIGLAHCKKIIILHGGRLWVESTGSEGSTFHFTIPFKEDKSP